MGTVKTEGVALGDVVGPIVVGLVSAATPSSTGLAGAPADGPGMALPPGLWPAATNTSAVDGDPEATDGDDTLPGGEPTGIPAPDDASADGGAADDGAVGGTATADTDLPAEVPITGTGAGNF